MEKNANELPIMRIKEKTNRIIAAHSDEWALTVYAR